MSIGSLPTLRRVIGGAALAAAVLTGGCAQIEVAPHLRPLSKDAMMLLGKKGMETQQPIFVRIFKEESELEVWKQRADGRFYHFKTYPICTWSGELGPKLKEGDKQAPEGFYRVTRDMMNPNSQFYLAFNLGYPNAFDKSHKRTGSFLMVHGNCRSVGCYAMTDGLMEEIYALAREAYIGGQEVMHVHAFPFRMTEANMARHATSPWTPFWQTLKQGYDHFEFSRQAPEIAICQRNYIVNARLPAHLSKVRVDPEGVCPRFERPIVEAFKPNPNEKFADDRVVVPGPKKLAATPIDWGVRSGLTNAGQ